MGDRPGRASSRLLLGAFALAAALASLGGALAGSSSGAPPSACPLVPLLRSVTVNQGLGNYALLVAGKETLVRFYLSMPACAPNGASIQLTGGTLAVSANRATLGTVSAPTPVPSPTAYPTIATYSAAPMIDSTGDPIFVVPASMLSSSTAFTASFGTTLAYQSKTSSRATPVPGSIAFSTLPGSTTPITAAFDKNPNPLGILFIPMGDGAKTYSTQWTDAAQKSLQDGMTSTFSRVYPLANGIGSLGGAGGLLYSVAPTLLDLRQLKLLDANGNFCGTGGNWDAIKAQLAQFRLSYNTLNPTAQANRVVGVIDPSHALGPPNPCFEAMASISSEEAWTQAINGRTGQLVSLETAHTFRLTPPDRESPFDGSHSQNTAAENPSVNRRYNVVRRAFIPTDRSIMKPSATSPVPDNVNTLFEVPDYAFLDCVFGGQTNAECLTYGPGTVSATAPVPSTLAFVMSGTTTSESPGGLCATCTGEADGTSVVESYFASTVPLTAPDQTSEYRLIQRGPAGGVLSDTGVPVRFTNSEHGAGSETHITTSGLFSIAHVFDPATVRIELWKGAPGGAGSLLLYARDRNDPPVLTGLSAGTVAPAAGVQSVAGPTRPKALAGASTRGIAAAAAAACTITWDGGAGTSSWHDAANWDTDTVPGAADHVCIGGGVTVDFSQGTTSILSLQSAGTLELTGGSLSLTDTGNDSTAADLTISGGTLAGAGSLSVSGSFVWSAGEQAGSGETRIAAAGSLTIDASFAVSLRGRTLRNEGTVSWQRGSIFTGEAASIENEGSLDASGNNSLFFNLGGAASSFHNVGSFVKSGGSGATVISVALDNDGVLAAGSGTVQLQAGDGGSSASGSFAGTGADGLVSFDGGSYVLGAGASLPGRVALTNATLTVAAAVPADGPLSQSGGTLNGAGTLTVAGPFLWTGGVQTGAGETRIAAGGGLTIASAFAVSLRGGRTLRNAGNVSWQGGSIFTGEGAVIENEAAFEASGDNSMFFNLGGAAPRFHNVGGLLKSGGGGVTTIAVALDNDGSVEAGSGTLRLQAGDAAATETGSFTAAVGATLDFNAGTHNLGAASSVSGAGTIGVSGASVTFGGNYAVAGTTEVSAGTAAFPVDATTATLDQSGGILSGAATVTVSGSFAWSGGEQSGAGETGIAAGGSLTIDASFAVSLRGRTLRNRGAVHWQRGSIFTGSAASIENEGSLDASGDNAVFFNLGGAAPSFHNGGSFVKSGGAGATTIQVRFDNDGSLEASSGTVSLQAGDGGGPETGSFGGTAPGALVSFDGGGYTLGSGAVLSGRVALTGATLTLAVTVPAGGDVAQSGGSLNGPGTLTVSGSFAWSGGTQTGGGETRIAAGGTMTIDSSFAVFLRGGRTLRNAGAVSWDGGSIFTGEGAVIENAGGFAGTGDNAMFFNLGGAAPSFHNAGTFVKSGGGGTSTIAVAFDNDGTLQAGTGTLRLQAADPAAVQTGQFEAAAVATLDFNSGTHTLGPGSSVSGPGTIGVSGASVSFGGGYAVSGTTEVSGGTAEFPTVASTGALDQSGGTLGGAGTLTVSGAFAWSGGTQTGAGETRIAAGGAMTIDSSFAVFLRGGRTLRNAGVAGWDGGSIFTGEGAVIENAGGFAATGDNAMFFNLGGAAPSFHNAGTFVKSGGGGTSTIAVAFDNDGTLQAGAGTLRLQAADPAAVQTGHFEVSPAAATLDFNGGTHTLGAGSSVSGAGTISVSGASVGFGGVYGVSGTTEVSGGTAEFAAAASTRALDQSGGTVTGGGTLTALDSFAWSGGEQSGTGETRIVAGASLTIDAPFAVFLRARTLLNAGAASWVEGAIFTGEGASIENEGSLEATGDDAVFFNLGGTEPSFHNAGTFRKSGGSGATTIAIAFDNDGTVEAAAATLDLAGPFANYSSATHTLTGGTYLVSATLRFNDADVAANAATVVLDGASSAIVDQSDVNGLRNLAANDDSGAFTITGGRSLTTSGSFANHGALTVGADSSFASTGDYGQVAGVTRLTAATSNLTAAGGAVNVTGGVLAGIGTAGPAVNAGGGQVSPGLSPGILQGAGSYTQASGGTLQVEIAGNVAGSGFDRLAVAGAATLGGTLSIVTGPSFHPALGDTFRILTAGSRAGTFATLAGADLGNGLFYEAQYEPDGVTLVVVNALTLEVGVNDASVAEGDAGSTTLSFSVDLSSSRITPVTVDFATSDGTATAGSDYAETSGTLTFAPGQTTKQVDVVVNGDTAIEPDETLFLTLSNATGGATISRAVGTGTILNDDQPAVLVDLTMAKTDSPDPVEVDGSLAYMLTATNSGATTATGVTISDPLDSSLVFLGADVGCTRTGGTLTSGGTVTCAVGTLAPGAARTFEVLVSPAAVGTLTNTATVSSNEIDVNPVDDSATATTSVLPTVSVADARGPEGDTGTTPMVFTFTLSNPVDSTVTVPYATGDGTAVAPDDYLETSGIVTFAPGETSATVTVDVVGDTVPEGDEYFFLVPGDAVGAILTTEAAVGTIENDDGNAPPIAVDDELITRADTPGDVFVLENDFDPDLDPLTVTTPAPAATHGGVSCTADGHCTYTPDAGYTGPDSFQYSISDGQGHTASATVAVTVLANQAPVAEDDTLVTDRNTPGSVNVLGNDFDPDGDPLTVTTPAPTAAHGSVTCEQLGECTYTPEIDFSGTDSFDYSVSDGFGGVATATVHVTVQGPNVPPVAHDGSVSTAEDTAVPVELSASDADGDPLTYAIVSGPAHGGLTGVAPALAYTPDPDYYGPDSFTFKANDGLADSNVATVTITVTPVNDAPACADGTRSTPSGVPLVSSVACGDIDGDTLTYAVVTEPVHGTLAFDPDGAFTYSPAAGFTGADSFTFKASDGSLDSNVATVSITVTPAALPSLSIDDVSVAEGDVGTVAALFTVSLSEASAEPVTVDFATTDGTATAGVDYAAAAGTLTFAAGETSKTVAVLVSGDTVPEPDETFFVDLGGASGATVADGRGVGTIVDDDAATGPAFDLAVTLTGSPPTVDPGEQITFVTTVENLGPEPSNDPVHFDWRISAVSSDSSGQPVFPTLVSATADAGTTCVRNPADAPNLPFACTSPALPPGGKTTFTVVVVPGPSDLAQTLRATSRLFNLGDTNAANDQADAFVDVNAPSGPPPSLSVNDVSVDEGDAGMVAALFTVSLSSAAAQPVTVDFATADGTASAPSDYGETSGTLTFAPGETGKTVSVPVNGDTLVEPDETFLVNLANASGATIADGQGVGTIVNDDVALATLTVQKSGSGSGTVTSDPPGIDCAAACAAQSHAFAVGTSVTLTGAAADDSVFLGWSGGGCSGTDPCMLVLGADTTVTAAFALPSSKEQVEVTASDDNPADGRLDLVLDCGPGQVKQVVAVGLPPTSLTATSATWNTTYDSSRAPADCVLKAVVADGFTRSDITPVAQTPVPPGGNPIVASISSPDATDPETVLQYGLVALRGDLRNAAGPLPDALMHWSITGPGIALTNLPTGRVVDVSPPAENGWPSGEYTATLTATLDGESATATATFVVLADADNDGIPAVVESQECFSSGDSDPLNAFVDDDGDGLVDADDPEPCEPASSYAGIADFNPATLAVRSTGGVATVDVRVPYRSISQILSSSVRIVSIADEDVSGDPGFQNLGWTVVGDTGTAKFDRQKLIQFLSSRNLHDRVVTITIRGSADAQAWTFEASDTTFVKG